MNSKYFVKALEAIKTEKYTKAIDLLTKAIEEDPKNADYHSHRGVSYFHVKNSNASIKDMNTSVELDPDYGYRYASRAYIKSTLGDLEGAISDYEKAVELDPEDSVSLNNLGMMQEKLGYEKKAKDNFEEADRLAKLMENTGVEYKEELKPRNIQQEINEDKKEKNAGNIISDVFTKKAVFKEFTSFILNGFKKK